MTIDLSVIEQIMALMKKHMIDEVSVGELKILKSHHNYDEMTVKPQISDEDLLFYSAE